MAEAKACEVDQVIYYTAARDMDGMFFNSVTVYVGFRNKKPINYFTSSSAPSAMMTVYPPPRKVQP